MGKRIVRQLVFSVLVPFFLTPFTFAFDAVPGEYVVLLRPQAELGPVLKALAVDRLQIEERSIQLIKVPELTSLAVTPILDQLKHLPEVELIEPNYIYELQVADVSEPLAASANDPELLKSWGLLNQGQPDGWGRPGRPGFDVGAAKAWPQQTGSKDIVVAVIDSGLNLRHPEFEGNLWINEKESKGVPGVDDDQNGYVDDIHGYDFVNSDGDPMDDHGHGTHVTSIIGAKGDNQVGSAGVAWNLSLMPLKFATKEGKGNLELGLKAIQYATRMGARIINNSWGGQGPSEILTKVVEDANRRNVLFVAAAGNSGWDNAEKPIYPASLKNENVISVAAYDPHGQLWNGSCYGSSTVHLGAPGFDVWGLWGSQYRKATGTSMAAPHVSGVAALVLSQEPQLNVRELKQRLLETAKSIPPLEGKIMGAGSVDAFYAINRRIPPPSDANPNLWPNKKPLSISSAHPYVDNQEVEWEVKVEGAKEISLYFETFDLESRKDFVELHDQTGRKLFSLTGKTGQGWSPIVSGDRVRVVLKADPFRHGNGFDLTQVAYR